MSREPLLAATEEGRRAESGVATDESGSGRAAEPVPAPTESGAAERTVSNKAAGGAPDVWAAFETVEIRIGTVVAAEPLPKARKPAYALRIDFGPAGVRNSSAQITANYTPQELIGRRVLAVTNLPPKRIAGFVSECLTLGLPAADGSVVLVGPDSAQAAGPSIPDGARLY